MQQGIDEQKREYDTSRSDFMPWIHGGTQAVGAMGDLLGLNGDPTQAAALDKLKASPLYQSLFNTGQEAVLQNASATGGIRGGNTERGLADFGRDTFSQVIQQQIANLAGVSGSGAQMTSNLGGLGANMANQVTSSLNGMGQVKAGGILGKQQVYNNLSDQISKIISSIPTGGF